MLSTATTDAIAPAGRLQFWNETVGSIFPGMVVDASADLRARWTSCALGDVVVATARSQRAVIRRWQGRVPGDGGGRGLIHLQHTGFSATEQCGRVAPLFGGDLTYCRPDERYGIDLSERNECYVIDLPLRMLAGTAAEPAVTIPHALPAAGMLHDFVSSILRQNWPDVAEPEEMQALGEMVGSLVRHCMTHGPAAPVLSRGSQHQRVLDYVEANLGDSALRTGRIAQALSLPPRVVQSVFVAMAITPSAFIIRRRLARAAERLRDCPAHGALTDLAYELGFSDAAHFSRRFKAAFGMSPLAFARSQRPD